MSLHDHCPLACCNKSSCTCTALVAALLGFCLFGGIGYVVFSKAGKFQDYEAKRAAERVAIFKKLQEEDAIALRSWGWAPDGKAQVPIDVATEIAVKQLRVKPVKAAGPVPDPLPVGMQSKAGVAP